MFLRLFSPETLAVLETIDDWSKTVFLRSAPGGGKTSLFRLLSLPTLIQLRQLKGNERYSDLHERLRGLGVMSEEGPQMLAVALSCQAGGFAGVEDLPIGNHARLRVFLSLLNSRMVLSALRDIAMLADLSFPEGLEAVGLESAKAEGALYPDGTENAFQLYEWASSIESSVYDAMDSFICPAEEQLSGHDRIFDLSWLRNVMIDDCRPLEGSKLVLMLDDVHKLSASQRAFLVSHLLDSRPRMGVLLGERLEALDTEELLASGVRKGRDYGRVVTIESLWRGRGSRFERLAMSVGARRAREARDARVDMFEEYLVESLSVADEELLVRARADIVERLKQTYGTGERYVDWVDEAAGEADTPLQSAVRAKSIELAIQRIENRGQLTLDFRVGVENLEGMMRSDLIAASELLLCDEFDVPYYYGPAKVARLASSNIEQFLSFSSNLFEEMISADLLDHAPAIDARRQQEILRQTAADWFAEIPRQVPRGREVRRFLQVLATICRSITYRPGVPYAPGVTGIGLRMHEHERLCASPHSDSDPAAPLGQLSDIIAVCLANNYLELTTNYKCQGEDWMLLHLNRAICLLYGLPLQTGDFSKQSLASLVDWPRMQTKRMEQLRIGGGDTSA